jgi:hypothetical protein
MNQQVKGTFSGDTGGVPGCPRCPRAHCPRLDPRSARHDHLHHVGGEAARHGSSRGGNSPGAPGKLATKSALAQVERASCAIGAVYGPSARHYLCPIARGPANWPRNSAPPAPSMTFVAPARNTRRGSLDGRQTSTSTSTARSTQRQRDRRPLDGREQQQGAPARAARRPGRRGPRRSAEIEEEAKAQGVQSPQYRARKKLGVKADQMSTSKKGGNEWWLSLPVEPDGQ